MIRLTYVTITYNAANVLQRTLDSVLSQDYPEIVHLIIDGASTDATLQLVDDYIERSNATGTHHRIQVTSEPDKGIYDAMNKGLRSIVGDYVCFLNAGDFLPAADTASKIAAKVAQQDSLPAVLYGDTDIVDGEGVGSRLLNNSRGSPSAKACSSAIRLSMLAPTLPLPRPTICNTVILPMSTGASV